MLVSFVRLSRVFKASEKRISPHRPDRIPEVPLPLADRCRYHHKGTSGAALLVSDLFSSSFLCPGPAVSRRCTIRPYKSTHLGPEAALCVRHFATLSVFVTDTLERQALLVTAE